MEDYKKLYFELFGKVEDAIQLLIEAQKNCEEKYINYAEKPRKNHSKK